MIYKYALITVVFLLFSSCVDKSKSITENDAVISQYYFIRHAEKDRNNPSDKNPHLTDEGLNRAEKWSEILGNITFDYVYSTDYNRTKETAKPTAAKNKVEITIYDPRNIDINSFLEATKGKTTLIVGHSNTTPQFVNSILKNEKYDAIDDSNNGNLYIISISDGKIIDQVLTIN